MKRLLARTISLLPTKRPVATQVMHASEDVVVLPEEEFPVLGFRELAERNRIAPLVGLLRTKLGFPKEVFDQFVRPVIAGYAEFLQLLPAAESLDRTNTGGAFIQALEVALLALDYRRGQILPRGAAPEVIGGQAHRWTYGVMVAALLGDADKALAGVRVQLRLHRGNVKVWSPLDGSMGACGAVSYRVMAPEIDVDQVNQLDGLPMQLLRRLVPAPVLAWLEADGDLMGELIACLSAEQATQGGAIGELVRRANSSLIGCRPANEVQCAEGTSTRPNSPRMVHGAAVPMPLESTSLPSEAEYLEDVDGRCPEPASSKPSAEVPVTSGPATGSAPSAEVGVAVQQRAIDEAQRFMVWLQEGVSAGRIRANEPGALVHGVPEGMLLVSPRIFREFAKQCREEIALLRQGVSASETDTGKWVLRQVLRAGWHLQADQGVNMLTYQVMRADRAVSSLSGVVIKNPERFVEPAPSVNPALVRAPVSQGDT